MSIAINVENLSKAYQLGEIGTGTISRDLERWIARIRGKEDPFLKIGETNDRTSKGTSDIVWSLKDLSFQVEQGDAVGVIGRNGAGKSTLLKLLSRVTSPTTGSVKIKGRVASLLEVGTGFHPELTGRENIFLNGAILGMRKKEIARKFDEIVDFSGVERYVDTPVKRYSSGMYVRLAFAVAAHLESEILIVDEVLAVGDMEFQKKCLGKMNQVSKGEGRTVLFVSHNMNAISSLCQKAIVLNKGQVLYTGDVQKGIELYTNPEEKNQIEGVYSFTEATDKPIVLREAYTTDEQGALKSEFECDEDIQIVFKVEVLKRESGLRGYVIIRNAFEEIYVETDTNDFMPNVLNGIDTGTHAFSLKLRKRLLPPGEFFIYLNFSNDFQEVYNLGPGKDVLRINLSDSNTQRGNLRRGYSSTILNWDLIDQ